VLTHVLVAGAAHGIRGARIANDRDASEANNGVETKVDWQKAGNYSQ
jgi:hypothetical protein